MEQLLNNILVDTNEINKTYNIDAIDIKKASMMPIVLSNDMIEIVNLLFKSGYYYDTTIGTRIIIHMFTNCINAINNQQIIKDLSKYVSDNVAEQILFLLKLINTMTIDTTIINNIVVRGNTVATLSEMIALFISILGNIFTVDELTNWVTNNSVINYIMREGSPSGTGYISIVDNVSKYAGQLVMFSDKEKTNIIGSIWNCIIDIIAEFYCNKVEDEGGEVNG